jgi:hypothetical protein
MRFDDARLHLRFYRVDRSLPPEEARKSLRIIQENIHILEKRAQGVYEGTYKEGAYPGLPLGAQYVKTENGKRVFKLPNGTGVIEE